MSDVSLHRKLAAIAYDSKQSKKFADLLCTAMMKVHVRLLESYNDEEKRDFDLSLWSYVYDYNTGEHIFSFKYYDKGTDKLRGIATSIFDSES